MADCEPVIAAFLRMLVALEQAFLSRASMLRDERGDIVQAVAQVRIGEMDQDADPRPSPGIPIAGLHFEAFLDAETQDGAKIGWWLLATRDGDGWVVRREIDRSHGSDWERLPPLPVASCADSDDLATRVPALVDEFLATPLPSGW